MSGYELYCGPDNPYLLTPAEQKRVRRLIQEGTCSTPEEAVELVKRHRKKKRPGGAPLGPWDR